MSNSQTLNDPLKWMKQDGEPPLGMDPSPMIEKQELKQTTMEKADGLHDPIRVSMQQYSGIARVQDLKKFLQEQLTHQNDIVFDFDNVEKLDSATIQTLLAFRLQSEKDGFNAKWVNLSENSEHMFSLMGLNIQ